MNLTCFDRRRTTPRSRSGAHSSSMSPSQATPSLKALDFYTDSLDSTFGCKTADAVQRFQQSYGIAATGEFDAATWYALTFWAQPA